MSGTHIGDPVVPGQDPIACLADTNVSRRIERTELLAQFEVCLPRRALNCTSLKSNTRQSAFLVNTTGLYFLIIPADHHDSGSGCFSSMRTTNFSRAVLDLPAFSVLGTEFGVRFQVLSIFTENEQIAIVPDTCPRQASASASIYGNTASIDGNSASIYGCSHSRIAKKIASTYSSIYECNATASQSIAGINGVTA